MILDSLKNILWKLYTKWEKNFSSALYYYINSKLNNDMDRTFWVWSENTLWMKVMSSANLLYNLFVICLKLDCKMNRLSYVVYVTWVKHYVNNKYIHLEPQCI